MAYLLWLNIHRSQGEQKLLNLHIQEISYLLTIVFSHVANHNTTHSRTTEHTFELVFFPVANHNITHSRTTEDIQYHKTFNTLTSQVVVNLTKETKTQNECGPMSYLFPTPKIIGSNFCSFNLVAGLVIMSATISSVEQCIKMILIHSGSSALRYCEGARKALQKCSTFTIQHLAFDLRFKV